MTITYPRSFPTTQFTYPCDFKLMRGDAVNRSYGGRVDAMELADPYWSMKATTIDLDGPTRAIWRAWNATLKGSTKRFYAFDPDSVYPNAYGAGVLNLTRHGGGSFDGTCTLTGTTAGSLSLSNLPDNFVFSIGDNISIGMSGSQRSLHLITEAVTGNSSGVATVSVEPPVRAGADNSAAVQLVKATCIMVMVPGTFSASTQDYASPISFEAVQTLA